MKTNKKTVRINIHWTLISLKSMASILQQKDTEKENVLENRIYHYTASRNNTWYNERCYLRIKGWINKWQVNECKKQAKVGIPISLKSTSKEN